MKYAYILFCVIPNSFSTDRTESNSSPKSNLQNVTLAQKTRHTHTHGKSHLRQKSNSIFILWSCTRIIYVQESISKGFITRTKINQAIVDCVQGIMNKLLIISEAHFLVCILYVKLRWRRKYEIQNTEN